MKAAAGDIHHLDERGALDRMHFSVSSHGCPGNSTHYGELLPVRVGKETFHIFNCMTFGKVDESKILKTYFEDVVAEIKKIIFDEKGFKDKVILKTDYNNCKNIYCTDLLKDAIEKSKLTGVIFSGEFAPEF